MWHLREEVVGNMVMSDCVIENCEYSAPKNSLCLTIVQEEAALPAQEISVDGRCGTALEVPLGRAIVRKFSIGVVKLGNHTHVNRHKSRLVCLTHVCDHCEPVVYEQPRDEVVLHVRPCAVGGDGDLRCVDHGQNTDIGCNDTVALFGFEVDSIG